MKHIRQIVLYMGLALGANAAFADTAALEALREGDMRKLVFHTAPKPASRVEFQREDGSSATLADYRGRHIVLNFWATWCAPCRVEMPMLSDLQAQMGGDEFAVVTIATGRNPKPAMERFLDEVGVENLPMHVDPMMSLSRSMGVLGLPVTVILDREGREIARLQGEADWNSESARAIIAALIAGDGGS